MISLSESTLMAFVVHEVSYNHALYRSGNFWRIKYELPNSKEGNDIPTHILLSAPVRLSILGTVTKKSVDFDCRPYLEQILSDLGEECVKHDPGIRMVPERALRLLLAARGVHFSNPAEEPLVSELVLHGSESFMAKTMKREEMKSQIVEKVLIIKRQLA